MGKDSIWKEKRRFGRFIGRHDPLLKVISVTDFSLEEICETPMTIPDNPEATIIHAALHDPSVLERSVRLSRDITRDLSTPETRRPVLRPLDFTGEWRRMKARQQGRSTRQDEEDEYEMEMEMARKKSDNAENVGPKQGSLSTNETQKRGEMHTEESPADSIQNEDLRAAGFSGADAPSALKIQKKTMDQFAPIINQIASDSGPNQAANRQDFVPMETRGAVDEHPERAAVEQYQEQLTERRMLAASDTAVVEQAEAKGYEDGFKQGQERALEAAQEAVRPHADLLSKVIEDLESKKKKVLENAQQNFNILTETLITSLLKREFKVNPESLAGVIQRAIQETVSDDQFSVEINPLTLAALMPLVDDRTKMKLNSNDQIPEGEFRIETKLAVVEGKINQIVKDLLDQADLSLFDTTEKAV